MITAHSDRKHLNIDCVKYVLNEFNRQQFTPEVYVTMITSCFVVEMAHRLFSTLPELLTSIGNNKTPKYIRLVEGAYEMWAARNCNEQINASNQELIELINSEYDLNTTLEWFERMAANFYGSIGLGDDSGIAARLALVFALIDEARIMIEAVQLPAPTYPAQMVRNLEKVDETMRYQKVLDGAKLDLAKNLNADTSDPSKEVTDPKAALKKACRSILKGVFKYMALKGEIIPKDKNNKTINEIIDNHDSRIGDKD